MCLKNSYLKRNVKVDSKDKATQEELDRVLVLSAKNMVIFFVFYCEINKFIKMTIGTYITIFWAIILFALWHYLYGNKDKNFSKATALVCVGAILVREMNKYYKEVKGKCTRYSHS